MPPRSSRPQAPKAPESMTDLIGVDPLTLEIGYGLIPLADPKQGGDLLDSITTIRRQAAMDMGVLVPAIRVRDNVQLGSNEYVVKLRGIETSRGEIFPEQHLAMNPGGATEKLTGIDTTEPAFGLPATWISEGQKMFAEVAGYTVVEPATVLVTHLTEIVRKHAADLLTRQETQELIEAAKQEAPAVVAELIPEVMTLGDVQKVLQNLLRERVSVKDIVSILEALADYATATKDTDILTEYVRQRLGLAICRRYAGSGRQSHGLHPAPQRGADDNRQRPTDRTWRQADTRSQPGTGIAKSHARPDRGHGPARARTDCFMLTEDQTARSQAGGAELPDDRRSLVCGDRAGCEY